MAVGQALDALLMRYQAHYEAQQQPLWVAGNADWQAPIYQQLLDPTQDLYQWQPVMQQQPLDFQPLAEALAQPLHASVAALFARWYAADLSVQWQQHDLTLLQIHGHEDGERLLANLAGHVLMKRRLRQPVTLFIGLAEASDDLLLSVDNDSGAVGLEFVGQPQHLILAADVAEFLHQLTPRVVANPGELE